MKLAHLSDTKFEELVLHPSLQQGLRDAGFDYCTPIQAEALPAALRGEDVAGQAQTGTGKTAAFLLAAFNRLMPEVTDEQVPDESGKADPRAIIIAPTRELALQIHHDAELLGKYSGLRLSLAYGGTDYDKQRDNIAAGTDVLIGTPGRLIDYLKQGVYSLNRIEVVVLDEADRMFDLGFIKDMRYILRRMPPPDQRLNMLFSATLSNRVMELAYEHMNEPRKITIESDSTVAENIKETVYYPSNAEKIPLMVGLLSQLDAGRTLVFTNTKHAAEKVGDWLTANGHQASVLTGDVPQKKRESLLKAFSEGRCDILVATDVAARGLHIPEVSHVFNFDLPQDAEDYVHRIGRTARAGASGDAISFACEDYAFHLIDIENYIGHPIARTEIDPDMLPQLTRPGKSSHPVRDGDRGTRRGRGDRGGDRNRDDRRRGSGQNTRSGAPGSGARTGVVPYHASEPAGEAGPATEEVPAGEVLADDTTPASAPVPPVVVEEPSSDVEVSAPAEVIEAAEPLKERAESHRPPYRTQSKASKWNNPNIDIPAVG
jgi:ATP-dependent RNA helicase RhlB